MSDGGVTDGGKGDGVRVMHDLGGHFEDFCFYSERERKLLEGFEQTSDMFLAHFFTRILLSAV